MISRQAAAPMSMALPRKGTPKRPWMMPASTAIIRTKMANSGASFPMSAATGLPPAVLSQALTLRLVNSVPTAYPAATAITTWRTIGIMARKRNWAKFSAGLVSTYSSATSAPGSKAGFACEAGASFDDVALIALDTAAEALLPGVKN